MAGRRRSALARDLQSAEATAPLGVRERARPAPGCGDREPSRRPGGAGRQSHPPVVSDAAGRERLRRLRDGRPAQRAAGILTEHPQLGTALVQASNQRTTAERP